MLLHLVLTPPDGKKACVAMGSQLPAPDFTHPLLQHVSTSLPQTPPPTNDWSTHMNNHSDSMGELSLYKKNAPDDIQSPLQFKVPENSSPKACLPSHPYPLVHLSKVH